MYLYRVLPNDRNAPEFTAQRARVLTSMPGTRARARRKSDGEALEVLSVRRDQHYAHVYAPRTS